MKKLMPLLLLLLFAVPLYSQVVPPKASPSKGVAKRVVPDKIAAKGGELVVVDAGAAKGDVLFSWDKAAFGPKQAIVAGKQLILAMPLKDGAYRVLVTSWEDRTQDEVTITVGGAAPQPTPDAGTDGLKMLRADMAKEFGKVYALIASLPRPPPIPDPTPTPTPTASKMWIVVIEETANATQARGLFFADKALKARIDEKGHHFALADKDVKDAKGNVPSDLAPWLTRASGKTLPHLFLIAPDGATLYSGELPMTPGMLLALIQAKGG